MLELLEYVRLISTTANMTCRKLEKEAGKQCAHVTRCSKAFTASCAYHPHSRDRSYKQPAALQEVSYCASRPRNKMVEGIMAGKKHKLCRTSSST